MNTNVHGWLALTLGALLLTPALTAQGQLDIHKVKAGNKKGPSKMRMRVPKLKLRTLPRVPDSGPMATFSAASFRMGEDNASANARPAHQASVKPFRLQRREVSVADYRQCVSSGKCTTPRSGPGCNWGQSTRDNHPINCVDWYQAKAYCAYRGMRLPTEQEWSFAARTSDARAYPWGNQSPAQADVCWRQKSTCSVASHPKDRTPKRVSDMAGNVKEWTASPFCAYSSGGCATTKRAVRGGGWNASTPNAARPSNRDGYNKGVRSSLIGFRCAADVPPAR